MSRLRRTHVRIHLTLPLPRRQELHVLLVVPRGERVVHGASFRPQHTSAVGAIKYGLEKIGQKEVAF